MHICKAIRTERNTMTENKTIEFRALLKCPDEDPQIINIVHNAESDFNENVGSIICPYAKKSESVDYSSTIKMYYVNGGGYYNFGIAYQNFFGNVLFVKDKKYQTAKTNAPCSLTDLDIKRICAAMGWKNPIRKGE